MYKNIDAVEVVFPSKGKMIVIQHMLYDSPLRDGTDALLGRGNGGDA
jgi:hypothetical protein